MSIALYMDTHVHAAITEQLRRRGVDVLTAQDDDSGDLDDEELLRRSTSLGRVIFTFDIRFKAGCRRETRGEWLAARTNKSNENVISSSWPY